MYQRTIMVIYSQQRFVCVVCEGYLGCFITLSTHGKGVTVCRLSDLFTMCRACAVRRQVIALGLDYIFVCLQKNVRSPLASNTTLQLGKFANPVSVSFGKASETPETQTLPAPNHTLFGSRYTVEPRLPAYRSLA